MCVRDVRGRRDQVGVNSLSGIKFYSAPPLDVAYCLAYPWLLLCIAPASGQPSLVLQPRQRGQHLDAANEGVGNGRSL